MEIKYVGTLRVYMETDTCDTIWRMLTGCMPSLLSVALFDSESRGGRVLQPVVDQVPGQLPTMYFADLQSKSGNPATDEIVGRRFTPQLAMPPFSKVQCSSKKNA